MDEALFDLVDHMVSRWTSEVRRLAEGRTEGEDAAFLAGVERANAPPIVCRRCGGTGNLNHFIPWANSATCFDCAGGGEVSHTPDLLLAEWKESRDKA